MEQELCSKGAGDENSSNPQHTGGDNCAYYTFI